MCCWPTHADAARSCRGRWRGNHALSHLHPRLAAIAVGRLRAFEAVVSRGMAPIAPNKPCANDHTVTCSSRQNEVWRSLAVKSRASRVATLAGHNSQRTIALRWLPVEAPMQVPVFPEAVRGAVVALPHVHLGAQTEHALQRRLRVAVNLAHGQWVWHTKNCKGSPVLSQHADHACAMCHALRGRRNRRSVFARDTGARCPRVTQRWGDPGGGGGAGGPSIWVETADRMHLSAASLPPPQF